ncbi:MAG: hypothetical protein JWN70_6024, partial [Planctomycetaceae bacterium]|nr:hypothetical protein [Planctomycetaceae bacterium]
MFPPVANVGCSWNEPWFFKLRSSTRAGWILRGCGWLAFYTLFAVLFFIEKPTPTKPEFSLAAKLLMPAMIATFFMVM